MSLRQNNIDMSIST